MSPTYEIGEVAYAPKARCLVTVSEPLAQRITAVMRNGRRMPNEAIVCYVAILPNGDKKAFKPVELLKVDPEARLTESWSSCVFIPTGVRS